MMKNPQEIAINMLKQEAGNNPILNNALNMAQSGNLKGVEDICRNICQERGIDPNSYMQKAMQMMKNM